MAFRRGLLLFISTALGIVLIAALVRVSRIDLRSVFNQLRQVSWFVFAKLMTLNAIVVYLSTEKWRSIDKAVRRPSDLVPSRSESFAVSSVGMALTLILPAQLGMVSARTLGTHFRGRPFKRGTAGTLLEQSFDLFAYGLFVAATVVTGLFKGKALTWTFCALGVVMLGILSAATCVRLIRWIACLALRKGPAVSRIRPALQQIAQQDESNFLSVNLARRLIVLSQIRFGVIVLMGYQSAEAVGTTIPLWQIAAAMPFVLIAGIAAVTPGALGSTNSHLWLF